MSETIKILRRKDQILIFCTQHGKMRTRTQGHLGAGVPVLTLVLTLGTRPRCSGSGGDWVTTRRP